MKMLFVSSRDVTKKSHGGFQCTNRNYESFCALFGRENVKVVDPTATLKENLFARMKKWVNYMLGYSAGLTPAVMKELKREAKKADWVFIDSSGYGIIARKLRQGGYKGKIISFFHNAELRIRKEQAKQHPGQSWRIPLMYHNEKSAMQYSDIAIALNARDAAELQEIYGQREMEIIPISFIDKAPPPSEAALHERTQTPPLCLFIGNNWYPNIHGLRWFVDKVLDNVDIKLQIVGTGMEPLRSQFQHPKIEFLGFVKDLDEVMAKADFMVSPIFLGSGMKVKTCESLMYGKNIIGTKEAFEGYEMDLRKVGALCDNENDFTVAFKKFEMQPLEKYNRYCREMFVDRYSFEATLRKFRKLVNGLD